VTRGEATDHRAYLLARLDEDRLEEAEARLLGDEEFARDLELAETDLVDDYVAGRLSDDDRVRVEELLAERPRLRERVTFARALAERAAGHGRASWRRPVALLAMAAALALVSTGAWWAWYARGSRTPDSVAAGVRPGPPAPSPGVEPGASGGAPPAVPASAPSPPSVEPSPVSPAPPPSVFAVLLATDVTRGGGPLVVRVPPATARVLFRVPIAEGDDYARYRLTLRGASDRVVARADGLRATRQRELRLTVAAADLPPRAELHVEGVDEAGRAVDLAFLPLDIRR
jgi:hypothetical protein